MSVRRLLLLDTASLYFRAFYGVPDSFRAADEVTPVNAVRGLLDFVARLAEQYRPTHLAACWDNDWRPAWRVRLLPSYKAHRVAGPGQPVVAEMAASPDTAGEAAPDGLAVQVPYIRAVLEALGVAVVGRDGFEADDVIGTLAAAAPMPTDVVTGDRDLFQVVDDARAVRVLYIARGVGRHEVVDDAWLRARYGVPASAYVDFATLRGDPSDGLPGVAGIGDKTAASLLAKHGSLAGILTAASRPGTPIAPGVRARLSGAIDYLAVAPEVVAVARDVDLGVTVEDLARPGGLPDPAGFAELADLLRLGGAADRARAALYGLGAAAGTTDGT